MFMVVQEGGSSFELYPHLFDTCEDAEAYRVDCTKDGGYCTTPTLEVPDILAKALQAEPRLEAEFLSFIQAALLSLNDLDMVDTGKENEG